MNADKGTERGVKDTLATFEEMQMGDIVFSCHGEVENGHK